MPSVKITTWTLVAALAMACGKNPGTYETAAATADNVDTEAVLAAADAAWADRLDETRLREAIDLYAQVVAADPSHRHAWARLTRGWYFLGDSHLSEKDAKIAAWENAIDAGKKCLALNDEFRTRVATEPEKDAVTSLVKADVPCLYWTASALGKWGKINGLAKILGQLPTIKAYISHVEQLDPTFFHYGPARYWGAYTSASSFTKDEEKSWDYFAASVEGAPYYLPTRGLRAGQAAVMFKNYDQFVEDITFILAFDVESKPELKPENTLEQKKARELWETRSELFPADVVEAHPAEQNPPTN